MQLQPQVCPAYSELTSDSAVCGPGENPLFAQGTGGDIPVLLHSAAQTPGLDTPGPAPSPVFPLVQVTGSISLQSSASHREKLNFALQFFTMRVISSLWLWFPIVRDHSCLLLAPVCAVAAAHVIHQKKILHLAPGW